MAEQSPNRPERFTYGAVVAIAALLVLLGALATVVIAGIRAPSDIAFAMSSIATPVVAIASAYFGIRVAGEAAKSGSEAVVNAAGAAQDAAASAQQSAAQAQEARADAHKAQEQMRRLRLSVPPSDDDPDGGVLDVDLDR